jgi:hypothetical protein
MLELNVRLQETTSEATKQPDITRLAKAVIRSTQKLRLRSLCRAFGRAGNADRQSYSLDEDNAARKGNSREYVIACSITAERPAQVLPPTKNSWSAPGNKPYPVWAYHLRRSPDDASVVLTPANSREVRYA